MGKLFFCYFYAPLVYLQLNLMSFDEKTLLPHFIAAYCRAGQVIQVVCRGCLPGGAQGAGGAWPPQGWWEVPGERRVGEGGWKM